MKLAYEEIPLVPQCEPAQKPQSTALEDIVQHDTGEASFHSQSSDRIHTISFSNTQTNVKKLW